MNRFHLRLFAPDDHRAVPETDSTVDSSAEAHEDILPFERNRRSLIFSGRFQAPVDRARLLNRNSECPECGRHDIEPLELEDAVISPRNRLPVPGTATIVGFHCNDCGIEWPVYELTRRSV